MMKAEHQAVRDLMNLLRRDVETRMSILIQMKKLGWSADQISAAIQEIARGNP